MRRRSIGAILLIAALLLLPTALNAKGKRKAKNDEPPIDSAKLMPGKFFGTLKTVPGSDRTYIVTVETANLVPSGKGGNYKGTNAALRRISSLQNQINQATNQYNRAKNASARNNALNRLNTLTAQQQTQLLTLQLRSSGALNGGIPPGFKLVKKTQDIEFQHTELAKVRTLVLPVEYDDKGELKKYTAEEKRKLRGKDTHLPGYESSLEKLNVGQKLKVTLAKRPKPPVDKEKAKEEAKLTQEEKKELAKEAKEREKERDETEKKVQVKLLVIAEEAAEGPSPGDRPRKK